MKQKILSMLLTVCMIVSLFAPITAFAAGSDVVGGGEPIPESTLESTEDAASETQLPSETAEPNEDGGFILPGEGEETNSGELPFDPTFEATEDGGYVSIMPLASGWEGEENEFYTKIRLTITDREGNPIEGAVYGLYRADNDQLVELLTTDRYGVVTSSDVPVDTDYYLLEYSTPEGFLPNEERKDIILTDVCAPSRVDVSAVYDPITGYIKVIKQDEDGQPLSGIGFYVYRSSPWELVDTIETDGSGEAVSTLLPYGWYELYEYSYPEHLAGSGYTDVHIGEDGAVHEVTITNYYAKGSARIAKTGSDGRSISGAVFSIFEAANDSWVEDITTNSSGYAYTSDLPLGDYYAVEKSVPSPYVLDTERQYFSLSYDGAYEYISVVNQREGDPGKIKVIKTDDSDNPLSGVVFGVYRSWDGKKMAELVTGADGTAEFTLAPDDYYLVELSGKTGYTMHEGQIPFTIDGSGGTVEQTVINPKIRIFGKVKVIKQDDAGNPIPGVRFGVYCHVGNLLEEIETGSDGTATSGILNEGTGYYLMELEGVDGYLSDPEAQYPFDITTNNTVVPVTVTNPRISGGIKIIKDDGDGNPLSGVVFGVYKGGQKLAELVTGEDGTVTSGTLYYGDDYELRELSTVEGYELIDTPVPFSILEQDVIVEIPFSNPLILGSVTVYKVDADAPQQEMAASSFDGDSSPMAGAVFGIYNGRGQKIAEFTIGADGTGAYDGLPKSDYFLKELAAPEGFVLPEDMIPFSITQQGENVEITVRNAKGFGSVKIIKSGEDEMLPGVVFEVYRTATGDMVAELTTGEDGTVTQELPLGRYYLIEKSTVAGYRLLEGRVNITLDAEGQTLELPIQNQKEPAPDGGRIRLIKISEADETPLPGAVFGIFRVSDDEKMGELITGSEGTATSAALPEVEDGYYLLELVPPTGFTVGTEKIPADVLDGETIEIAVENAPDEDAPEPGTLEIIKNATDTGERLAGAVFGVYRTSDDAKVGELKTDKDGKASMELPAGDFYLKELTAPAGFQPIEGKIPFSIVSGATREIIVENEPIPENGGTLAIIKRADGTDDRMEGVVFGIYRKSDDTKVAEVKTDRYGEASYQLPAGDYYLKELSTIPGFQLLSNTIEFSIQKDKTKEITVTNKRLPSGEDTGSLLIIKKAAGTGRLLPDAVFGVYQSSNNQKVMEITTNNKGEATAELPAGDYYLKELRAPASFVAEPDMIPFRVKVNATVRIEVTNTQGRGEVKPIKVDDAGKPLAGGVFTLYRQDGTAIAELTTKADGTATYELPVGKYYLVEKTAPASFALDTQRHSFTVENGKTAEVKVVNYPLQGSVDVYFRHVDDSRELASMKTYTDKVGSDYIKWMRANGYENMPIEGYTLLRTDYPASFVLIDGKLVVTLWYSSPGAISIPKTGETPPYMNYLLAALSWSVSALCGVALYRMRKKGKRELA
ncbi:hypothetical protein LJC07_06160 [Christensenellaceae bacterium OttesenSCG-928-L17]|nr:hypothetical protein [Christensenellaceae bacterium OttesenSCG-928-L17]